MAYRAYDPHTRHVTITHDAVFDESVQWDWSEGEDGGSDSGDNIDNMFTMQYWVLDHEEDGGDMVAEPRTPPAGRASLGEGFLTLSPGVPSAL
jgi:hypothetical protein